VNALRRYRTIWISDVHLGGRGAQADALLDFLKHTESEHLFLAGDIVDGWQIRKSWYWPQSHNDVIQKLLRKARKRTKVVYIPGNHDEGVRDFVGFKFGGIRIVRSAIHTLADGRRLLVLHGDEFDGLMSHSRRWLAMLGHTAYDRALRLNRRLNAVLQRVGWSPWPISAQLKHWVKSAGGKLERFRATLLDEVRRQGVDGLVCGHIHHAELREDGGLVYANSGDWVESCTALVEHLDGRLEILRWADLRRAVGDEPAAA
jgi:UDP-2,3-diacylglucosamine pyrophosphatase LpxH